jgi:hypothetical protein
MHGGAISMSGSEWKKRTRPLEFGGAEQDARAEFQLAMTRLREKLKSIPPAAAGLSGLRWEQVRELIMAIMSYALAGRQPELSDMLRTSGLSRDQWYTARDHALALGLITTARRYRSRRRAVDQLAVDQLAVDQLARGPTNTDQVRLTPNRSDQHRPSPTRTEEYTTRAALELPNKPSTSTTKTRAKRTRAARRLAKTVEVVEEAIQKSGVDCRLRVKAIRHAVRVGKATRAELLARVAWFALHAEHYAAENRGGALYVGIHDAERGMSVHQGWPHSESFLEQEARRERERKHRALAAQQQRADASTRAEQFERERRNEREFGAALNGMSDEELAALERECYRDDDVLRFIRGKAMYRVTLLERLAQRQEGVHQR